MPVVQTTPAKKIGNDKIKKSGRTMSDTPGYYGDAETLKSGSALVGSIPEVDRKAVADREVNDVEMCHMPGMEEMGPQHGKKHKNGY